MSWDSYIDSLIGYSAVDKTLHIDKGCIFGQDGAKWTTDAHGKAIKVTTDEAAKIGRCFKSKDFTAFQASGIHLEGQKYQFLREDHENGIVYAKAKGSGALTIQATKTAIVVGHCPEGGQPGECNKAVGKMADYLISLNM